MGKGQPYLQFTPSAPLPSCFRRLPPLSNCFRRPCLSVFHCDVSILYRSRDITTCLWINSLRDHKLPVKVEAQVIVVIRRYMLYFSRYCPWRSVTAVAEMAFHVTSGSLQTTLFNSCNGRHIGMWSLSILYLFQDTRPINHFLCIMSVHTHQTTLNTISGGIGLYKLTPT